MEFVVLALALLFIVGYSAYIAFSIQRGKPWALDAARAISRLDSHSVIVDLRGRRQDTPANEAEVRGQEEQEPQRLAA